MLTESICSGKWNCHFNQSKRQQKPHLTDCWLDGRVQIFSITFPSRGHALEQKRCHAKQRTPTLSLKPWHTGVGYFGYDQIISCLHWSFYVLILTKNGYILIRNMYLVDHDQIPPYFDYLLFFLVSVCEDYSFTFLNVITFLETGHSRE